jgi:hypothetical protein
MTDYDELARKAREATPGEWAAEGRDIYLGVISRPIYGEDDILIDGWDSAHRIYDEGGHTEADAAYIAAASPDVILALLEERKVLRERFQRAIDLAEARGKFGDLATAYNLLSEAVYAALQAEPVQEGAGT